jgi:hypothetical protein
MKTITPILFLFLLLAANAFSQKILRTNRQSMAFSAIKGTTSKPDSIILEADKLVKIKEIKIAGAGAQYFKIISPKPTQVATGKAEKVVIAFEPAPDLTGLTRATLEINGKDALIGLTGLSTKGLEGENEAPLSDIVSALGYSSNVGWKTLANNLKPDLQGDELPPSLFRRNAPGTVEMIPVARYSPDFPLHFGYYINSPRGPRQIQTGTLAKAGKFPEHQTLFPKISSGKNSFDPGDQAFGFFALSPDHALYSEDCWNMLFHPAKASHAVRIYPVKNQSGTAVEGSYLVCMEEAANGDFNDYVFLVKNVRPVTLDSEFHTLMNGKNFDGWHKWFQGMNKNEDPENIFTMEQEGIVHDTGQKLGYIMTEKGFDNFHLKLEFKWGEKKWPPRENAKRDSGICYNIPDDTQDFIWPQSVECQIQEGDVGDFWLLEYSTIQVDGKQNAPSNHTQIVKKKDAERPSGEWNTVEVISYKGKCVHIVNGVVVNYGENASITGGRILLQSEYAEIFYRNIRLRAL